MPIGSALSRLLRQWRVRSYRNSVTRADWNRRTITLEVLGTRQLLSTVSVLSASTADSKSLTISYLVNAPGDPSLSFGVYRSASASLDSSSLAVGTPIAVPSTDSSGQPSTSPGLHQVTIPVTGGLTINPKHPYVVVEADPGSSTAGQPGTVASFRKASIAIVTHGGIEDLAWKKTGPPWEVQMAKSLREQGYDEVIAYNWVAQSSTPGQAVKQAPKLTAQILGAVAKLPAGEPVDLQFIGHSEGAVVNTQTIVRVEQSSNAAVHAGFLEDTLLDPHAANPDFPGRQYSTGGPLGWIAKLAIDNYQAKARDPLVFIPSGVDLAQVFYQQTPANRDHGTNDGIYNLWGQVPVKGTADYYDLTAAGIVHSGKQGVAEWYEHKIVPTLGEGAPALASSTLTASVAPSETSLKTATYSGTAEPGAIIRLSAAKGRGPLHLIGKAVVGSNGTWSATTRSMAPGTYRVIAESKPEGWTYQSRQAIPTDPLGQLKVAP